MFNKHIIFIFVLFLLSIPSCKSADDFYKEGLNKLNESYYTEAIKNFDKAIEKDPQNIDYQLKKAEAVAVQGNNKESIELYLSILEKYPKKQKEINQLIRKAIEMKYELLINLSPDIFTAKNKINDESSIINIKTGENIIGKTYDNISSFNDDYLLINNGSFLGLMDKKTYDMSLPVEYLEITNYGETLIIVKSDNIINILDKKNLEQINESVFKKVTTVIDNIYIVYDGKYYGVIDIDNENQSIVYKLNTEYGKIQQFNNECLIVTKDKNKGLYDIKENEWALDIEYKVIEEFNDELLLIQNSDNKYGLYDILNKKTLLPTKYKEITDFKDIAGKSLIKITNNEDKKGLYDLNKKEIVLNTYYHNILDFTEENVVKTNIDDRYGLYDIIEERLLLETKYSNIEFNYNQNHLLEIEKDNKFGLYDIKRKVIKERPIWRVLHDDVLVNFEYIKEVSSPNTYDLGLDYSTLGYIGQTENEYIEGSIKNFSDKTLTNIKINFIFGLVFSYFSSNDDVDEVISLSKIKPNQTRYFRRDVSYNQTYITLQSIDYDKN